MRLYTLLCLICTSNPTFLTESRVVHNHVDIIEINHCYNYNEGLGDGSHWYILWDYINGRYECITWKKTPLDAFRILTPDESKQRKFELIKKFRLEDPPVETKIWIGTSQPMFDWNRRLYILRLNERGFTREITSTVFFESYTTFDPEMEDKKLTSVNERRVFNDPMTPQQLLDKYYNEMEQRMKRLGLRMAN